MALFKKKKRIKIILEQSARLAPRSALVTRRDNLVTTAAHFLPEEYSPYLRRSVTNKSVEFTFYDLARIKNANQGGNPFVDLAFDAPIPIYTFPNPPSPYPNFGYGDYLTAARQSYHALLLKLPETVENPLLEEYREQLTEVSTKDLYVDAELYNTGFEPFRRYATAQNGSRAYLYSGKRNNPAGTMINDNDWQNNILKTKKEDSGKHLKIISYGYYEPFDTGDTINYKVTEEANYNSPAIEYSAQKGATKIFLVRRIYRENLRASGVRYQLINGGADIRSIFGGITFPDKFRLSPRVFAGFSLFNALGQMRVDGFVYGNSPISVARREIVTDFVYQNPPSRVLYIFDDPREDSPGYTGYQLESIYNWINLQAQYPEEVVARFHHMDQLTHDPVNVLGNGTKPLSGALLAVLKQESKTYYVWAARWNPYYDEQSFRMQVENGPEISGRHVWNLR